MPQNLTRPNAQLLNVPVHYNSNMIQFNIIESLEQTLIIQNKV